MNLGQILTAVQARGYGSDTSSQQTEFVNSTYRDVCGERRWWWLETQYSLLMTTAGDATLDLAPITDYLSVNAVRLSFGAEFYDLDYAEPQDLRSLEHIDRNLSVPRAWTFVNGKLHFYPTPDRAYTVVIDYIRDPPDLVNSTDTPLFPATYHDILVWGAIRDLAYRDRGYYDEMPMSDQKFERLLERMRKEQNLRQVQSTRQVERSGLYDRPTTGLSAFLP